MSSYRLAIVIPYYKHEYFGELLSSLAQQTDQRFNLYVGDDCAAIPALEAISQSPLCNRVVYHRFTERKGHLSLTDQWNRCLDLVQSEDWIWVLPDDDMPSENAVAEFHAALDHSESGKFRVIRLATLIVDSDGREIGGICRDPEIQTNVEFYSRVVRGQSGASLGDNIFHRKALLQGGGFVSFPKAWGSDHATILRVAAGGFIFALPSACLKFRMSGINISSDVTDGVQKIGAKILFLKWINNNRNLFPGMLCPDFYRGFYFKGEYYVLNEWRWSLEIWRKLYELRKLCLPSPGFLAFARLFIWDGFRRLVQLLRMY